MSEQDNLTMNTADSAGFYMPGEWQLHSRCWMVWPMQHDQWEDYEAVECNYAAVAHAIHCFEPVTMVADPLNATRARELCGEGIDILELPNDDSWARDIAPSFLKHKKTGRLAGVDWRFNCWGGHYPQYHEDAQIAGRILDHLNLPVYRSSLTLEGGAIHVDGEGTIVTSESCALNTNRNFGLDKAAVEKELQRATGATKTIWVPGDLGGETSDMTDGHIDGIMCFIKPGVVLFERDASNEAVSARLDKENRRALELATDARGRKLEIVDLVVDHSGIGGEKELFCSSYANFYIANGGIIMPSYGTSEDNEVRDLLKILFPDREVVMVNIDAIAPGGGGIHCITQQQPD